jgi:deoxyribose-phosphate aldolase
MKLKSNDIARMIDISAVQPDSTQNDIRAMIECAIKYNCFAIFALPGQTLFTKQLLGNNKNVNLGGVVGFPDGGQSTKVKATSANELANELGCDELDMVINIGMLKSEQYDFVENDIRSVVEAAGNIPVKVILECYYLTNEEIKIGCERSLKAGAAFVKNGTGWSKTGATEENIGLMKKYAGDKMGVKAAGGVRDLDTLIKLYKCGATRFGVGTRSVIDILEQCDQLPNGEIEV